MQSKNLKLTKGFRVGIGNKRAQSAEMVIPPGDSEGGPDNEHHGADQWLFIIEGTGVARVEGKRVPLRAGTLLLIEKGEEHEVKNTGRRLLRTLNIYVPPAFRKSGARLPRGR
jgi:mannose-6-phosphate isomerase-like protein (cupin superfamily)